MNSDEEVERVNPSLKRHSTGDVKDGQESSSKYILPTRSQSPNTNARQGESLGFSCDKLHDYERAVKMAELKLQIAKLEMGLDRNDSEYASSQGQHNPVVGCKLPKLEIEPFSGDPKAYIRFIAQFHAFITPHVQSPRQRLHYLTHFCKGRAKVAIQDCVILEPEAGYSRALDILKCLYGREHVIVRATLAEITEQRPMKLHEVEKLDAFALKLRSCQMSISRLKLEGELNSYATLEATVRVLPME